MNKEYPNKEFVLRITDADRYFPRLLAEAIKLFRTVLDTLPVAARHEAMFELGPGSDNHRGRPAMIGVSRPLRLEGEKDDLSERQINRAFDTLRLTLAARDNTARAAFISQLQSWQKVLTRVSVLLVLDLQRVFPKPLADAISMFEEAMEHIPVEHRSTAVFELHGYSEPGRDHPTIQISYWRPKNAAEVERTRYLEGVSQRNALRMQTLRALTAGPRAVAIPRLLQMLTSDSRDAVAAADAIVKHFLGPEVIDGLKAGLSHPAIGVRWHCVDGLSKIAGRRHEAGVWAPGQAEFWRNEGPFLEHWKKWTTD